MPKPTKLVVQIPCLNEEAALPVTLGALPREFAGVDSVEVLIINDGSTDRTVEVARDLGVEHVVEFKTNRGLARAFVAGLRRAHELGADYLVNLDADNQYNTGDIGELLAPLIAGEADMVVGERPIEAIKSFSYIKKKLQAAGSWVVRRLSHTDIRDSASGFRAMNRKAMANLFIFSDYTYTHESLIAAGESDLRVTGVPIRVNEDVLRPSRLMKSPGGYIYRSGVTILRFYLLYNPRPFLVGAAAFMGLLALAIGVRFLVYYALGEGGGHMQSLILGGILATGSMMCTTLAILADIVRINRKLLQTILSERRGREEEGRD
jgi:glycosyltransferase involved in cell wall biosynthesis